jgi:hypothetical protein
LFLLIAQGDKRHKMGKYLCAPDGRKNIIFREGKRKYVFRPIHRRLARAMMDALVNYRSEIGPVPIQERPILE